MAKINILPSEVFNLIAAGEVVERPASVVKELVENSLDAGSTEISITIEEGGTKKIRVADNGCGIEKPEIKKVFLPHATSKIRTKDDLERIGTLGFRGEALASIAAVSKVSVTSRTKDDEIGATYVNFPKEEQFDAGCAVGTVVEASELFYCVPARAKFLKKAKTEEAEIKDLVSRYILAHPLVSFRFIADGKTVFQSTGKGLEEALFAVYGKEAVDCTIKVDKTFGNAHITGFIGKPTFSKPNRTYQTLVLNGRYIQNLAVQTAVTNAYGDFLMKRQYPFYILFLNMPLESVDVNVHPNKMEVRFSSDTNIYPWFFETVVRALHQNDYKPEELKTRDNTQEFLRKPIEVPNLSHKQDVTYISDAAKPITDFSEYFGAAQKLFDGQGVANGPSTFKPLKNVAGSIIDTESGEVIAEGTKRTSTIVSEPPKPQEISIEQSIHDRANEVQKQNSNQVGFGFAPEARLAGKVFNTYLIVEQGNEVLFIDQHAMHERILFDKLKAEIDSGKVSVQPMLIPHLFSTNAHETAFLEDHITDFAAIGFEIEQFGENSFKISAIPAVCSDISLSTFVSAVLSDIREITLESASELIRDKLATRACKSAIKGGDDLSKAEIDKLLELVESEKTPLRCPHGRPAIVRVSRQEIEKWFKRIV